ncbi:MAG TPA: redox-sensing transcriptional repressor Rex [Candidatus Ozemobacteraceae bacterium]|nr:redox-sensing transcriptional repressor Rex [Candidatus Ozemobacteraceae bacterium]
MSQKKPWTETEEPTGTTALTASEPTLRRLPVYHHYLQSILDQGRDVISCTHIATDLKLDPTQVRKDLATTGIVGKPKVGYEISVLLETIESFLGWNNTHEAFLVGVGHLGAALLGYSGFSRYGLKIIAAFDTDKAKIGTSLHGIEIRPLTKLENLARRLRVRMAVMTVPAAEAQAVADLLSESGIEAIWNFAPVQIQVPDSVIVQHENLAAGLSILSAKLTQLKPRVRSP